MKLHVDDVKYPAKPKDQIGQIKARLQSAKCLTDISLEELAAKIGQGYSVSPGVMIGGKSAEHWTQQHRHTLWWSDGSVQSGYLQHSA